MNCNFINIITEYFIAPGSGEGHCDYPFGDVCQV